jgi:hypothetical protein
MTRLISLATWVLLYRRSGADFSDESFGFLAWHYLLSFLAPYLERPACGCDTLEVQAAADDVVTDTRKVLDAATADQDDGVLLEVVAFTTDVSPDFVAVAQADTGNLTKAEFGFFGVLVVTLTQTPRLNGAGFS